MKTLLATLLTFAVLSAFAQTDIIEMKSRNASIKNYERTFTASDSDHLSSNFGMRAMVEVKNAVLDSVVCVSDSVSIMYTSEYCTGMYNYSGEFFQPLLNDSMKRSYPNPRVGTLWDPGIDTVINHPLFSHRHSLDSVKEELDRNYYFKLPSDSVTFIGFDNAQSIYNEDAVKDVRHKRKQQKNGFGWELMFMILSPIVFLLGMSRLKLV